MSNKVNNILEEFDSLSIEEQEVVLDIEKKRLIDRKRQFIIKEVEKAEEEFKNKKIKPESVEDIMKAIDEADPDK